MTACCIVIIVICSTVGGLRCGDLSHISKLLPNTHSVDCIVYYIYSIKWT